MHEASIALNIIEIAEEHCLRLGYATVDEIEVEVGAASGVLSDALLTAFDIVKAGTITEGATLLINDIPLGGNCRQCGRDFTTGDAFIPACPNCGGRDFFLDRGRELNIVSIEVS